MALATRPSSFSRREFESVNYIVVEEQNLLRALI
tara:strand:- start:136 stop:237 length:102 start_codon:yes stop_codon:yes gene_type:complete